MLIDQQVVETANATEIGQVFTSSLNKLFPGQNFYSRVKLVVNDAAPYMVKCFCDLKCIYPDRVHVTCIVHLLHRVAEEIRQASEELNDFIAHMKALLVKS